ncbi:unnamed protein product [Litomosoides sigmodontis]|uniref:Major facilitator superfamily (MFS) profile domain-containing protein n=1 Tax=Litomosoides sigmodontis TaxID=42156 RepID=A0A3P6TQA9_LITSI|nr:unnamed protein product [Litomosoides sigmodontis]
MATEENIKPTNNAWYAEGIQDDANRELQPFIRNDNQSSSKLLLAEDNSKTNGHGDKDGSEEGDLDEMLPVPPDGGYGWVIVFAAFMSNFVVDGIANSFGAFMSIYQDHFKASKALVSLIGSLLIGCYLLIGPIAGGLVNRYGARIVVIIGSFVAGLSFLASIFCWNIYIFMTFYGFLGGAGFGLIYLPSIVTVGYYFEKKRSIATGIAVAGSGVGTFVFPPLCIVLINQFGWKIAVCALAALSFSSIIYGLLYRPLQTPATKKEEKAKSDVEELLLKSRGKGWKPNDEDGKDGAANDNQRKKIRRVRKIQSECETHDFDETTLTDERGTHNDSSKELGAKRNPKTRVNSKAASATDLEANDDNLANVLSKKSSSVASEEFDKPLNRRDMFYSGSTQNLPEFKSEGDNYQSYKAVSDSSQAENDKLDSTYGTGGLRDERKDDFYAGRRWKWVPARIHNILSGMIDISLMKEPAMFLLCISNLCGMLGFYVPFMFLIDMAVAKGHTKGSGSLLLSVIGVTNTIGRIAFGWLADRGWLSALTINNFALLGCGTLTCLCPLLPGYGGLMIYSILFGFIISAYISLTSIVLVDELGLDRLTNSFGLLVVSRGIASLLGTPLAGIVYDMFTSYDASFYFAGVIIILSGLVSCLIPVIHRCKHDQFEKEAVEEARMVHEDIPSGKLSVHTKHLEENLVK